MLDKNPAFAYRPHLDGLRAVAVLMVFVFHAAPEALPGGFIGVDVFFVLSGYLITSILLVQSDGDGIRLADFYRRRLQRLLPAAFAVILTVIAAESIWGSVLELGNRRREALATVFYVANWNLIGQADDYFAEALDPSPLRHMWSLAIEEQFYLVWPIVLVLALKLVGPRRSLLTGIVVVAIATSAALMTLQYTPLETSRLYYGTDTRLFQPLAGALLALLLHNRGVPSRVQRSVSGRSIGLVVAVSSLAGIVGLAIVLSGAGSAYFQVGAIGVTLLTATLILSTETPNHLSAWLETRPLVRLGEISYGFYLWHWPIILWLAPPDGAGFADRRLVNLLQLAATMAVALASHRFLETPIRRQRNASTVRVAAFGALSMSIVAVGAFALLDPTLSSDPAQPVSAAAAQDRSFEPCPDNPRPCVKVEGASEESPTVVLIGDSTAQAYDPALKVLAETYGFRYVQAAVGGCPIGNVLLATGRDGELHKQSNFMCFEETPSIYEEVLERWNPDLILFTSSNDVSQMVVDGELLQTGSPEHLARAEEAIRDAVSELTAQGARAAFIEILPPGPGVTCLERDEPNVGTCTRDVDQPSQADAYNEIYRQVALDNDAVAGVLELRDLVCPDAACPLAIDGVVVRYDGGHFTATWSASLATVLDERLRVLGVELDQLRP